MAKVQRKVVIVDVNICDWCKQEVEQFKDGQSINVLINGAPHKFDVCQKCYDEIVDRLTDDSDLPASDSEVPDYEVVAGKIPESPPPPEPEPDDLTDVDKPRKKRRGRPPGSKSKKKTTRKSTSGKKKVDKPDKPQSKTDPAAQLDLSRKNDTRVSARIVKTADGEEHVVTDVVPGKVLGDILRAAGAISPEEAKKAADYDAAEALADGEKGMKWDPVLRCFKFPVDITRGSTRRKMAEHYEAHNDALERIAKKKSNAKIRIRPEG